MIEVAALAAAAVLLVALVSLEVRFVGQDAARPVRPRILGVTVGRTAVIVLWVLFLLLTAPRLLDLLL
jgi:hypothetical protein